MSKRLDINRLRMAIIDRDLSEISAISADIPASTMLEAIIEIWLSIYYGYINTMEYIIAISGVLRNISGSNAEDIANLAVRLSAIDKARIINTPQISNKYDIGITDMYKILSNGDKCPPIHKEIYKRVIEYLPANEQKKIIPIIFYFSQKSKSDFFNSISIFINDDRKSRLISEIPHFSKAINTHYISLIAELCRLYVKAIQDANLTAYYNNVNAIYSYKLKIQNIFDRINLLYHIFDIILDDNIYSLPDAEIESTPAPIPKKCISAPAPYKYMFILPNIDEAIAKKRVNNNPPPIEYKYILI